MRMNFLFFWKKIFYIKNRRRHDYSVVLYTCKGGMLMGTEERIAIMEEEIRKLKQDNEMLMNTVIQMRMTINRLLVQFISIKENG